MARVRTGEMRNRVLVQTRTETASDVGSSNEAWATDTNGERWAAIETLNSDERFSDDQTASRTKYKITMRFYSGLNATQRIVEKNDGRIFNIVSIDNVGDRDKQTIVEAEQAN